MKKIICVLLIISSLLALHSCVYQYPAKESTEEEKRTVLTIDTDIGIYKVPFEVYRAIFLTVKPSIDGGNESVWNDAETAATYKERAHSTVKEKIAEIYTAFYLAKKNGIIDPYSDDVERRIDEYIKIGVEGGVIDGENIAGYGGDYDKYLDALRAINLNYNAHVLFYRYRIVMSEIYKYYLGENDDILGKEHVGGNLQFTKSDVEAFYNSDECIRVLPAYIQAKYANSLERAEKIRIGITEIADNGEAAVSYYINSQLITDPESLECGLVMGRYSLEKGVYKNLTEKAFALSVGDVSEVIRVEADEIGYYVLYGAEKSKDNFESYYDDIVTVYLNNCVGQIYDSSYSIILSLLADTDYIKNLDFNEIRMP